MSNGRFFGVPRVAVVDRFDCIFFICSNIFFFIFQTRIDFRQFRRFRGRRGGRRRRGRRFPGITGFENRKIWIPSPDLDLGSAAFGSEKSLFAKPETETRRAPPNRLGNRTPLQSCQGTLNLIIPFQHLIYITK